MLRLLVKIGTLARGPIRIIALSRPEPTIQETFDYCFQISMQENNTKDIARIVDSGLNVVRYFWLKGTSLKQVTCDYDEMEEDLDNIDFHISNWTSLPPQSDISLSPHEEKELAMIRQYLIQNSAGLTLWARLILEQLLSWVASETDTGFTLMDLRTILKDLPTELDELYGHILDTLSIFSDSKKRATSERMLNWIVGSQSWGPFSFKTSWMP